MVFYKVIALRVEETAYFNRKRGVLLCLKGERGRWGKGRLWGRSRRVVMAGKAKWILESIGC